MRTSAQCYAVHGKTRPSRNVCVRVSVWCWVRLVQKTFDRQVDVVMVAREREVVGWGFRLRMRMNVWFSWWLYVATFWSAGCCTILCLCEANVRV